MRTILAMLVFYLCFVTQATIFSPAMLQLKSETPSFDVKFEDSLDENIRDEASDLRYKKRRERTCADKY